MSLVAVSLRVMLSDYSRALQFSILLFLAAMFSILGGYFMAGSVVMPTQFDVSLGVLSLVSVVIFSYLFVWYAAEVSESLGHRAYLSREELFFRGLRVSILWALVYVLSYLLSLYIPFYAYAVLVLIYSVPALYASVAMAVDGLSLGSSLREGVQTVARRLPHVGEFLVLGFLLVITLAYIDVFGYVGQSISVILGVLIVLPWLATHVVLTYLYKYPLVVTVLNKLQRL